MCILQEVHEGTGEGTMWSGPYANLLCSSDMAILDVIFVACSGIGVVKMEGGSLQSDSC